MKKLVKLIILIILSMSVYIVYNKTTPTKKIIMNIGDGLSLGINSYGIKEYGFVDYYKEQISRKDINIITNSQYSKKDLTIKELQSYFQTIPKIKKELSEAHLLFLTVGYNDLIYKCKIEENLTTSKLQKNIEEIEKDYNSLIEEIKKYYKNEIIVIGYYRNTNQDEYVNNGIRRLNHYLKSREDIIFIDTYNLFNNQDQYFSNPNSYFPNRTGYQAISAEIIKKTLEKQKNI